MAELEDWVGILAGVLFTGERYLPFSLDVDQLWIVLSSLRARLGRGPAICRYAAAPALSLSDCPVVYSGLAFPHGIRRVWKERG